MVGFAEDPESWNKLISKMQKDLRVNNLGNANWMLGMKITTGKDEISIDQTKYIKNILIRHQMQDCKPVKTPIMPISETQFKEEEENKEGNALSNSVK